MIGICSTLNLIHDYCFNFRVVEKELDRALGEKQKLQMEIEEQKAAAEESEVGCANKDLVGFFGPLCKFIEYCRIVALLPVIPLGIR